MTITLLLYNLKLNTLIFSTSPNYIYTDIQGGPKMAKKFYTPITL